VSRNGIGIVAFESLAIETKVLLVTKEKGVPVEVVWCRQDTVRTNIYHIGVVCKDVAHNLIKILETEGLLKADRPSNAAAADEKFDLEALRPGMAILHTYDQSIFRHINAEKLAKQYRAYPISHAGRSLAIMLPLDLKPADAAKLSDEEAAQRLLVIRIESGQGIKIWPK
jgi:hypothetical protein